MVVSNYLSFRALFNWSRPSDFLLAFVFAPVFDLLFYGLFGHYMSVEDGAFYLTGGVMLAACLPALSGGVMSVTSERYYGTLHALLISPNALGPLFLRPLPYALFGALAGGVTLPVGMLLLDVRLPDDVLPVLLGCLLCGALSSAALGMLLGVFALYVRDIFTVINLAMWFLSLALGLFVPPSAYPTWLTVAAHWVPGYHALSAARTVVESGAPVGSDLAIEAARAAGLIVVGMCAITYYRRQVRRGRTSGLD
ncbi:ABC-2 type transport system permease protein [Streptomyces sp. 3330]|uniref:ABC transporter permease n=1 Tax=Streptomyces sp. 3330 TaxID=2817755 RepID=UPI00285AC59F|nr:ABC transporter permease [Streptomyces sp. 3330]MDR6981011.1 ABC-2 type transport system permease protein [Streptomyces sp. 3330]